MYHPNIPRLILSSIFVLFSFTTILSQNFDTQLNLEETTQVHVISLKNGKKIKGRITAIKNEEVFFYSKKNKLDTIFILSQIKNIKVKDNLDWKNKTYDTPLDYVNYLFFTNTAFGLKEGDRMYRTFMGTSILGDRGVENGFSVGLSYSFPLFISINTKFYTPASQTGNVRFAFKSTLLSLPIILLELDNILIFENALIFTKGTPDRFINIAFTNYYSKQDLSFFFEYFPTVYHSVSVGGGIRMNDNWQLILENHINFNNVFIDGKLLPSIGFSYSKPKFNFSFGYNATNQFGFNLFPILDFSEDDLVSFKKSFLSRAPYFTFAKLF